MSQIPESSESEIVWTRYDYEDGTTIWQRECPDCDHGLIYAPVDFCPRCNGSGYLTTLEDPNVDT